MSKRFAILFMMFIAYNASGQEYIDNDQSYVVISNQYQDGDFQFNVLKKIDIRNFDIPNCIEVPLDFLGCNVGVCSIDSAFGKIIAKLKGRKPGGGCEYVERTSNIDGMNCTFNASELPQINQLLNARFKRLSEKNPAFEHEQALQIQNLLKRCDHVQEHKLSYVVTIDDSEGLNEIDPEFNIQNFAHLSEALHLEREYTPPQSQQLIEEQKFSFYKSIFFTEKQLDAINQGQ